ncbi:uncharacterized protein AB675_6665 [Cyphellophora attinorum]|uniref:Uncharacterized protein n=1 Tax=Cyphellophora attinorum TaxID=1664694 RepID=A0A0N1H8T0_9EURO|nr:uncharacterized protein AB675_6665 [Phialophora attinorum]KPI43593.1 hypothetical protein AB675_6665 [Phialophora attinorum]
MPEPPTSPTTNQSVMAANDRAAVTIAASLELITQSTRFSSVVQGCKYLQDIAFDDTLSTVFTDKAKEGLHYALERAHVRFELSQKMVDLYYEEHPEQARKQQHLEQAHKKGSLEQARKEERPDQTRMATGVLVNISTEALTESVHNHIASEGWTGDDDTLLAEYIVLMLVNGKTQTQVAAELSELLEGDQGTLDELASWLFQHIESEQAKQACKEEPPEQARKEEPWWKNRFEQAEPAEPANPVCVEDGSRGNHTFWISGAMNYYYGRE